MGEKKRNLPIYGLKTEKRKLKLKIQTCKIMGLVRIFRKEQDEKRPLVKNQPVSAIWWVGICPGLL